MNGNEFGDALIGAIEFRLAKRGELTLTLGTLKALVREALDPSGYKTFDRPPEIPQLPVEPEYPRLRVRYDRETGRALEHKVIYDVRDEIPYMRGWYVRPMSELAQLEQGESK